MVRRLIAAVTAASLTCATAAPVAAQNVPNGLGDLIGARGSSVDYAMGQRGYTFARNSGGAAMWWNASQRTCASVSVNNGRVQSIQTASSGDCGQGGGGNGAAAAVAAVALIGLAAALAAHEKKGDHSGDNHDAEYERGYHDAMYGASYANDDSEGYHSGYMAGQAERNNRQASNSGYVRRAPPAAQAACSQRGDAFLNVPPGSSVPVDLYDYGQGKYEITVASGHYRARCSVDRYGNVSAMNPY